MPINALTAQAGLRIGPLVLETLVKHYFERLGKRQQEGEGYTALRQEELLYDEAFQIVRAFLDAASHHTVEEVQAFSNTWTPSPPWVHLIRLVIPRSCCDEAATILTRALGGEERTRQLVGGVKWWQVRGLEGVDAQWIAASKDWKEAERKYKAQGKPAESDGSAPGVYEEEMDEMRCILYAHGGGYYFGSVDQERYSIQRHARKINGRVFAVNYRLAPQYPFPCALQDMIAAYLYLINPPPGANHKPVKPAHIVIAGDSAGGGLSLALLQVIRDTALPAPAGAVLISPWCDLTHSFPSIHTNTATDVIPRHGLSLQKPSPLWPPPSDEAANEVQSSLRSRIRQALHIPEKEIPTHVRSYSAASQMPVNVGATTPVPSSDPFDSTQRVTLTVGNGEVLTIDQQIQLYTQNSMLAHPLVSPALSFLGGLPPLLFIVSDKEVLRDEIIYTAHKAAHPAKYPIKDSTRRMYPPLYNIENRCERTRVHIQVYDDTAHVLPVLFSFTTPAKFCYRAIASFVKYVTGMTPLIKLPEPSDSLDSASPTQDRFSLTPSKPLLSRRSSSSLRRSLSASVKSASSIFRSSRPQSLMLTEENTSPKLLPSSTTSSDVGGPRFQPTSPTSVDSIEPRYAGEPSVYSEGYVDFMIRERVSTRGVIRPLEPESELDAFTVPEAMIGRLSELAVRRYLDAKARFDQKYAATTKSVEKQRKRTVEHAKRDLNKMLNVLRHHKPDHPSDSWGWAWLIDGNERPPPSSIAARRDTDEARRLAKIADQAVIPEPKNLSGNNLWSVLVGFLTVTPDAKEHPSLKTKLSRVFKKETA